MNPAPESGKKAKDARDKTNNSAPDIIADATALDVAKKARDDAAKKVKEAKLAVAIARARPFELYMNLLSDKAWQPWEKIIKAQVTQAP